MAKILRVTLPQPGTTYNRGLISQLIRILQRTLNIEVQLPDDVAETEAINFFINN